MNKDWSELNKTLQRQIKKEETFAGGVQTILKLRRELFDALLQLRSELAREDFDAMPFMNAEGYHSKTIAYSIWHIFRIEDIVAHTLVNGDEQIFFSGDFVRRTKSPIVTTGNELEKNQIAEFSKALDLDALYQYAADVMNGTNKILKKLSFADLKRKITNAEKERLERLRVVSPDEKASWLIDYWCGKDVRGLIQMPFTRHWIMHVEASLRIKGGLARKG